MLLLFGMIYIKPVAAALGLTALPLHLLALVGLICASVIWLGTHAQMAVPLDSFDENRRRTMKVIVMGCGRMGEKVAWMLSSDGHEVAVIDADPKLLAHLGPDFPGRKVHGHWV